MAGLGVREPGQDPEAQVVWVEELVGALGVHELGGGAAAPSGGRAAGAALRTCAERGATPPAMSKPGPEAGLLSLEREAPSSPKPGHPSWEAAPMSVFRPPGAANSGMPMLIPAMSTPLLASRCMVLLFEI